MSELKAYGMNDPEVGDEYEMYKVSDVDKVIADLEESHKKEVGQLLIEIAELKEKHKTEVKELLCLIRDKENNFNRAFDSEEKEIRHHKRKRCLAMAKWCELKRIDAANYRIPRCKWEFYDKWHKRWLELAKRFKGAK